MGQDRYNFLEKRGISVEVRSGCSRGLFSLEFVEHLLFNQKCVWSWVNLKPQDKHDITEKAMLLSPQVDQRAQDSF